MTLVPYDADEIGRQAAQLLIDRLGRQHTETTHTSTGHRPDPHEALRPTP
ncbi:MULTISPECIES: hypothetical protein [unclassified Streptomyces]|nr:MULTISPECIES: hypothetical protein [unclassified Streptomyces]